MPVSRDEIERELNASEADRAIGLLRRTNADFEEIERELQAAEKRKGLEIAPDIPLVSRLARLGYSERDLNTVMEMLAALDDLRNGRPISERARAMLSNREAARRSADQQLAAIIERRRGA